MKIQTRFALLGFFVLLIFVGCFLSATFFIYSLFDGGTKILSVPLGIIWGAIVVNMYLLLLHTISPAIIPLSSKSKVKNNVKFKKVNATFFNLSMTLRIIFMVLLAIIVAQPLNVFLFSTTVQTSIEKHKIQRGVKLYTSLNKDLIKGELIAQKDFIQKIHNISTDIDERIILIQIGKINQKIYNDSIFLTKTSNLLNQLYLIDKSTFLSTNQKIEKEKILNNLGNLLNEELDSDNNFLSIIDSMVINGYLENEFKSYKSSLSVLVTEKINNYNSLKNLLDKSNFYVKTIQLLFAENPVSWLITVLVCLLFILPIYIKYKIRDLSATIFKTQESNRPEIIRLRSELIDTQNFQWLQKSILTTNINNIKTSDYYFQRMLIEHRIILEEYEITKKNYSQLISQNIRKYNANSLKRLLPLLEKLKDINFTKYTEISKQIFDEYIDEEIVKYEYWLDSPFRTKLKYSSALKNNEQEFLNFIYSEDL